MSQQITEKITNYMKKRSGKLDEDIDFADDLRQEIKQLRPNFQEIEKVFAYVRKMKFCPTEIYNVVAFEYQHRGGPVDQW